MSAADIRCNEKFDANIMPVIKYYKIKVNFYKLEIMKCVPL